MKLSKFKKDQVSVSSLKGIKGGKELQLEEGSSHTLRHSTSCTGTDHDAGRHDSDQSLLIKERATALSYLITNIDYDNNFHNKI